jgi:DivIVA domain-containing protein
VSPDTREELNTGARIALGVLAAGVPAGVVWWLLAPVPRVVVRGPGVFLVNGESETAIAADGWFAVCTATAGLVAALVVFALARRTPVGALLGLSVGGLAAALLAWRLGVLLGPDSVRSSAKGLADGARFDGPLELSARGVLLAWPLVSVGAYFALTAGLEPPGSRSGDLPGGGRRFPVTVLRPGYAIEEVDELLGGVEAGDVTAEQVRAASFSSTRLRRGYDEASVDAALVAVTERLTRRDPVDG